MRSNEITALILPTAIINLLEHSLAELEKLSEHHGLDLKSEQPELLYLFNKIEIIKTPLLSEPNQPLSQQK